MSEHRYAAVPIGVPLTREQFLELADGVNPIGLLDGRMGLCPHWDSECVLVDAFRDNECETVRIPFRCIAHAGNGALVELPLDVRLSVADGDPVGKPMWDKKVTKVPWPTRVEWDQVRASCGSPKDDFAAQAIRDVRRAFEQGCDYVSLQSQGREVGRIYRDGRSWVAPI